MRAFTYDRAPSEAAAILAASRLAQLPSVQGRAPVEYLAGGTTLIDLMKLDVMRPAKVVDLGALAGAHDAISVSSDGVRLGAMVRMATAADHPEIVKTYPVISQSLQLAASAQLRNMATLGGNVLQRTRCPYFRDISWAACNKRDPGSGCAAMGGVNRQHAILGGSSDCIATYPGDFAQSLIALDATVNAMGSSGDQNDSLRCSASIAGRDAKRGDCSRAGRTHHELQHPGGPVDATLALSQDPRSAVL